MTAFDAAWSVVKESGPPLNRFDFEGDQESMPKEGWQDFRIPMDGELPPAGNFPDKAAGWYPTTRVVRMPDGKARITMEPTGSNINLHPLASILGERDPDYERLSEEHPRIGLTDKGEDTVIAELASTGHHEAIHQAVHSPLRETGLDHTQWEPETDERGVDYSIATEWAANLGQHYDRREAWNQLLQHSVFRDNDEILDIADKVLSR
jgi:hypothetical protein